MVGLHFKGKGKGGEYRTPKVFAFVGQQHASNDGGHVGHGKGLRVVPRADDDEHIGRETVGQGRDETDPYTDIEHQHENEKAQHADEDRSDGTWQPKREYGVDLVEEVGLLTCRDVPCGHAAKHRVGPKGRLARGLAVVNDFFRHALVHLYVMLFDAFALKDGGEIYEGDDGKTQYACGNAYRFLVIIEKVAFHRKMIVFEFWLRIYDIFS